MARRLVGFVAVVVALATIATARASAPPGYLSDQSVCGVAGPAGFTSAQPIEKLKPSYPPKARNEWSEGWVFAEFAINATGQVRNVSVIDAVGAKDFVATSVAAIAAQQFKPAQRNGVPAEQHLRTAWITYVFSDTAAQITHPEFADKFEVARRQIQSNRLDEAIGLLERALQEWRLNLYETAMSSYLLAVAYAKKEDWQHARYYIEHAVSEGGNFLNKSMKADAMELVIKLRAQAMDFAGALCGFQLLTPQQRTAFASLETDLRARLLSDAPLVSDGKLLKHPLADQPGTWRRQLQRRKFSFANIGGEAKSFRLACVAAGLEGPVDPTMLWTVPEQAGTCMIWVFGAPGAAFKLVEEW